MLQVPQTPPEQLVLAPLHAKPQLPQLLVSVVRLTQLPEHEVCPVEHSPAI